jgi:hypothetical protein
VFYLLLLVSVRASEDARAQSDVRKEQFHVSPSDTCVLFARYIPTCTMSGNSTPL